jgi:hypothetical protein
MAKYSEQLKMKSLNQFMLGSWFCFIFWWRIAQTFCFWKKFKHFIGEEEKRGKKKTMHFTFIFILDIFLCWFLPWYIIHIFFGIYISILVGIPIIFGLSILYMTCWFPKNSTLVRGNPRLYHLLYNHPLHLHGPGKEFDPGLVKDQKYIVGAHPHGFYPMGVTIHFTLNMQFFSFRTCVHWILTTLPILKEFTGWAGCIDATRECMLNHLKQDDIQGLIVCPGSVREGLIEPPGTVVKRTGFISIAQECGAHLIPVYDATSASLWDTWLPLGTYFHERLRYPWPVLAKGSFPWYFSPFPKRNKPIHLYIGNPIPTRNRELGHLLTEFYDELNNLRLLAKKHGHLKVDAPWK